MIKRLLKLGSMVIEDELQLLNKKDVILVKYFNETPNWGDELNKYLLEKITGKEVVRHTGGYRNHLLGIGSVLGGATKQSVVWGSGLISDTARPRGRPQRICSVRGPMTRERLHSLNIDAPDIYGDPGILISRYYDVYKSPIYKLGFVPHYTEKSHPVTKYLAGKGVRILDIQKSTKEFVDDVRECENIISSSLHGLICADAYSIPNKWIKLTSQVLGEGFKFHDYYLGFGQNEVSPLGRNDLNNVDSIVKKCRALKLNDSNLNNITGVFPNDLCSK